MTNNDFEKFTLVWRATLEYYNQQVTDGSLGLSFKNLQGYELADIERAINAHIQDTDRGRWSPKVSDIIGQIEKTQPDGRLPSDEAWSIALQSFNEHATVVLNDEIAGALQAARDIYEEGDKVGARMAFKSAYERIVEQNRASGVSVHWWPSFGFDPQQRQAAIDEAIAVGRLPAPVDCNTGAIGYAPRALETVGKALENKQGEK